MIPIMRQMRKSALEKFDRLIIIKWLSVAVVAIIASRLIYIQVIQHPVYSALAQEQYDVFKKLFPDRGRIFAQNKASGEIYPVAINDEQYEIYAIPRRIKEPNNLARTLAPFLEMEESEIFTALSDKNETYHLLKRKVVREINDRIMELSLKGIGSRSETMRFYPEKNVFSHAVGFLGFKGSQRAGQYGVEGTLNEILAGQSGYLNDFFALSSASAAGHKSFEEAKDGADIVLTIDRTIQFTACTKLRDAVLNHGAEKGAVIVMNPKNGEIWAICSYPDFDPNEYQKIEDASFFNNSAIFQAYEPGSTFKAITMAAGLDKGLVDPQTIHTDTGSVTIGKYTIRNADGKVYGRQTMTQVLENSVNTGAIFVANKVGGINLENFIRQLGFGEKTGIELSGESKGNITALAKHKDIYIATASYGQGITTTPIQMIRAYATMANGGYLVKPTVIKEIRGSDGQIVSPQNQSRTRVFSERTSLLISAMLGSVVENGHGKRAGVKGYYIGGKTGTAQVAKEKGSGYDPDKSIGSFIGYGPIDNPQFVMLAKIDNPKDVKFAESTAAPLFGEIAQFLVQYLKIPPSR